MKIILQIIATLFLAFAIMAGFSSAREWIVLNQLSGYQKDLFTLEGAAVSHENDDGTSYYLRGHGERDAYKIAVSAARYEAFRSPDAVGQQFTVFRNPSMPSLSFQTESLNVIFEENWKDRSQLAVNAKSTLWLAVIALVPAILLFSLARILFRGREVSSYESC